MADAPVIVWFRRDLRLADHAALMAATAGGRPVIALFIHDQTVAALGAAARWRLGQGLAVFAAALASAGSRLILRRGPALAVLQAVVAETGAAAVFWLRGYDADAIARDRVVKAALAAAGVEARSFAGALLHEPSAVATGEGRPYSVFTPFWRVVRSRDPGAVLVPPARLRPPAVWPASEALADWRMSAGMGRGAGIVAGHARVGEAAAGEGLERFVDLRLARYPDQRDLPGRAATSGLSENLAWGEISARRIWHRVMVAREAGNPGAEKFLSELVWREFAWHLLHHHPGLAQANWRAGWEAFPWRADNDDAEAWRRGMTGEPFVDAAMREMYVTGRMHNRARMVAASYLTKHLLTDWRVGLRWFADCLIDWDPAANAMGWQWVAGSGPDAAPYFRIFNPGAQAAKFDADGAYRRAFIAEGQAAPPAGALAFFAAVPRRWELGPDRPYPAPLIDRQAGRARALAAHATLRAAPAHPFDTVVAPPPAR